MCDAKESQYVRDWQRELQEEAGANAPHPHSLLPLKARGCSSDQAHASLAGHLCPFRPCSTNGPDPSYSFCKVTRWECLHKNKQGPFWVTLLPVSTLLHFLYKFQTKGSHHPKFLIFYSAGPKQSGFCLSYFFQRPQYDPQASSGCLTQWRSPTSSRSEDSPFPSLTVHFLGSLTHGSHFRCQTQTSMTSGTYSGFQK